jgi:ATP-binding cassette subfamily F protein 3
VELSLSNVSKIYTGRILFDEVTFLINKGDRAGLVGKNGVGKSTLLKILVGEIGIDSGSISRKDNLTIGYLPQEMKINSSKTIVEETLSAFKEVERLNLRVTEITKELTERTDYESQAYLDLITELTESQSKLNILEAGKSEEKVEKILLGLGFSRADFGRGIGEFSGGWQMRVELAKLILTNPDILLLDEPTNHLDIESIVWLEEYFKNYSGAIIMISHDRRFLDNVTNRTIEISLGKIYDYKAPYSKFMKLREERILHQELAYKNQQRYIAQQEKFIERFRAKNTKAKQVQSKLKQLDKLDRVEFDNQDMSSIQFRFPPASRSGDITIKASDLSKNYDELNVLKKVNLEIERGEKVAFVGKNGQGKSTLVKIIVGDEDCEGELKIGHNVDVGYYAQVQENTLDENKTVYQTIEHEATGEWAKISKIRGLLGTFLFGPEDIEKKVKVLSGGEKSRLAMAKLLLKTSNLLVLDEPTNHLDMDSKEILKTALKQFNGTLIVVSHDRDFLNGLTDKVIEFSKGNIKEHIGDVEEFLKHHEINSFREFEMPIETKAEPKAKKKESSAKVDYEQTKLKNKQQRKLRSDIAKLEDKIADLEDDIKELEDKISKLNPGETNNDLFFTHGKLTQELDKSMSDWEDLNNKLES